MPAPPDAESPVCDIPRIRVHEFSPDTARFLSCFGPVFFGPTRAADDADHNEYNTVGVIKVLAGVRRNLLIDVTKPQNPGIAYGGKCIYA